MVVVKGNVMVGVSFDAGGDIGEAVERVDQTWRLIVTASGWSGIGFSRGTPSVVRRHRISSRPRRFTPISSASSDLAATPWE